tara:strand:+ start:153 stop:797 length:645 start_codon:yes stop_codon:yes gene_type:complete
MIKKIKQTKSEKFLLIFLVLLFFFSISSFFIIKNKCLFVKNYNPDDLVFDFPQNIAVLKAPCGNVIIELYPEISPNSVKRFIMLIKKKEYDGVAFHRVIKNVLVQSGDIEFGKKNNLNYSKIGNGKSKYGTINSETDTKFNFLKGTVALARAYEKNTEDTQFFILLRDAPLFEGEYTPIGRVLYGLNVLEKIKYDDKMEYILRPDFIEKFRMLN